MASRALPWFKSYADQDWTIRMLPRNTGYRGIYDGSRYDWFHEIGRLVPAQQRRYRIYHSDGW